MTFLTLPNGVMGILSRPKFSRGQSVSDLCPPGLRGRSTSRFTADVSLGDPNSYLDVRENKTRDRTTRIPPSTPYRLLEVPLVEHRGLVHDNLNSVPRTGETGRLRSVEETFLWVLP